MTTNSTENTVAIIGMSGRFPGANHIDEYWSNLKSGKETITLLTEECLRQAGVNEETLLHPRYVKAAPLMKDIDKFDYPFFGMNKREAELLDPQHRMLLMCAWEALEDAGCVADTYEGLISVFAGCGFNNYLVNEILARRAEFSEEELQMVLQTNSNDYLSTRISYKLNLRGTSVTVQTACSTSLVAVHYACQSLLMYQSDMALAGGASLRIPSIEGYKYQEGGIFSPDGHCRAFDAEANGTIFGSGSGMIALKRLEDALADNDHIYALIKGSAVNNDGATKVGYTAPSIEGQRRVIAEALMMADIDARSIGYLEAHGTGTALGDPIEIAALQEAFGDVGGLRQYCAIGSVKTNMGHLNAASGIAGLIKTALMLYYKQLPPSLHFNTPSPVIPFIESPFYVNTVLQDWEAPADYPRRAGVSSFGIGGTNAHLVLEEAPAPSVKRGRCSEQALLLSARTHTALDNMIVALHDHLQRHPDTSLEDAAYTLQLGRKVFSHRYAAVTASDGSLKWSSRAVCKQPQPKVVMMFPGPGSHYPEMAAGLYDTYPLFQYWTDQCIAILQRHSTDGSSDWKGLLSGSARKQGSVLEQTAVIQPLVFVVEYALARCLMEWGLEPHAMIGHGLGEYVAACIAGVMTLEDALAIVVKRGAMMQQSPSGVMIAVAASFDQVSSYIDAGMHLSASNSPESCTFAGEAEVMSRLMSKLDAANIGYAKLSAAHAFHSPLMTQAASQLEIELSKYNLQAPTIPYVSNVTGNYVTSEQAKDIHYWSSHMSSPVKFSEGILALAKTKEPVIWLEVGPGKVLSQLLSQHKNVEIKGNVVQMMRHPTEEETDLGALLTGLSMCWLLGAEIQWEKLYGDKPRKAALPTYAFEQFSCWINDRYERLREGNHPAQSSSAVDQPVDDAISERTHLSAAYVPPQDDLQAHLVEIWEQVLGFSPIGIKDNFFELGGHSLLATQLISRLRNLLPHIEIQFERVFVYPTIEEIAGQIELQMIEHLERTCQ
ncbi:type I polyketide synthase [Paenibacillus sp. UMB4589-SE434]|uniref:type I polyketide synthase n=1 Tax=Paenibacillus sp. UMB4589-SE434 TaxID=3046314 RepID=UPI00254C081E|nr:type I polyketide synthase [Paenibacillus sp. UMB4589-SE434]MDK8182712.1 type I polyketide synthase [Paenibacillus sp. UMB4589-SE434]